MNLIDFSIRDTLIILKDADMLLVTDQYGNRKVRHHFENNTEACQNIDEYRVVVCNNIARDLWEHVKRVEAK